MMLEKANISIIEEKFGTDYKMAAHGELTFNCPFCVHKRGKADKDHKLYVNSSSLKFHCFKCGSSGKLRSAAVETDSAFGVYEDLLKLKISSDPDLVDDEEENTFFLPVTQIKKGTVAYDYCMKRGITEDLIKYYDIRLGVDDMSGRIVIPNNVYGTCWTDMYSARSVIDQIPKYKNPTGVNKNNIVFNLKSIKENQPVVIIVEGVITAICGGKDCVAVYGCHPTRDQIKQILDKKPKNVICCLDGDEAGQTGLKELLHMLDDFHYDGKIYYVIMPKDQDACDMGYKKFRQYVKDHVKEYSGDFIFNLQSYS